MTTALALALAVTASAQQPAPAGWKQAQQILKETGVTGGLVAHVGCGENPGLTLALRAGDAFIVQGLETDTAKASAARKMIQDAGLYGPVSVLEWSGGSLPYADNLARLLVIGNAGTLAREEIERVLCPGGVAVFLNPKSGIENRKLQKPWPKDMDEWTHYLYDSTGNPVSKDLLVGPPRSLRWTAGPKFQRSHNYDISMAAMVSAQGRVFYFLDEGPWGVYGDHHPQAWVLVARDAFSGVPLWKRPLTEWGPAEWEGHAFGEKTWATPFTLNRRMLAVGGHVYATLKYRSPLVTALDAATGKTLREIEIGDNVDEMIYRDGKLFLRVRQLPGAYKPPRMGSPQDTEGRNKRTQVVQQWMRSQPPEQVVAVDAASGKILWRAPAQIVQVETLTALNGRVFYRDWDNVVALDAQTGKELWRVPVTAKLTGHFSRGYAGMLLVYDRFVFHDIRGGVRALDAATGQKIWDKQVGYWPVYGYFSPVSTRIAQGLIWTHAGVGYDPVTGQEKRKLDLGKMNTGKIRCYRAKATERYLLDSFWGLQCSDLVGDNHSADMWVRAECSCGFMPANGLIYSTPNPCNCFMGTLISGFNALAARPPKIEDNLSKFEKGPAFSDNAKSENQTPKSEDWPMYRRDARRSGHAASPIPNQLAVAWTAELGGQLTQPVVAGNRLYVARKDTHEVICLDGATGKSLWRFTAGGPVNSPPTIAAGRAVFGSADGWVYCLCASGGALAWRSRVAPAEERIVADGRVESAWPCDGSVLAQNGLVYAAAGRSSFLDGGIVVSALDLQTGEVKHSARLDGPWLTKDQLKNPPKNPMAEQGGCQRDLFVSEGGKLFMNQMRFDSSLKIEPAPRDDEVGGVRRMGAHLMATGGFLDDTQWHRIGWQYAEFWPGFNNVHASANAGHILCFDGERSYAASHYNFADRYPDHKPGEGNRIVCDWLNTANEYRGVSQKRKAPPVWSATTPLIVRAILTAPDKLNGPAATVFVAGLPDANDPKDPLAPYEGRGTPRLAAFSAADGKKIGELVLPAPVVWDGMAAADGQLFVSQVNGQLVCLSRN